MKIKTIALTFLATTSLVVSTSAVFARGNPNAAYGKTAEVTTKNGIRISFAPLYTIRYPDPRNGDNRLQVQQTRQASPFGQSRGAFGRSR